MIDEYDVTYAVKEWLIRHGWKIIAFNPPGAQGTFTIPNPSKDPRYRGQTGSKSPDLIGVKDSRYLLVLESKPIFDKKDVMKLVDLVKNKVRLKLLLDIVEKVCKANDVKFNRDECILILGKAHGGASNVLPSIETFIVSTLFNWNSDRIEATVNPLKYMKVNYIPSSEENKKIMCAT